MKASAPGSFGARLRALRDAAGFTQEELATIAGLSVHAISALERGERRRPHVETVRALTQALDLMGPSRDALICSARPPVSHAAADELSAAPLPVPLTTLLGRDGDLQTLRRWLAEGDARLITLLGPGGVGKTRLALELANTIVATGTMRVVFVPLACVRGPAFVALAIAEALGLTNVAAADVPARVRVACGTQPTLLILDNYEHVLEAAPLVVDLLTSAAALRVLATSRAPLRLRGERAYLVGPLSVDARPDASGAGVADSPAVRLFLERVRDAQPGFRLIPASSPIVEAICRRLDALPLALELAAPWLKVLTPEALLQRLDRDVLLSHTGSRDLPERQRTINATVAWSYQLLDDDDKRVFRHLGALPGRFSIDAAAAVLDDSREAPCDGNDVLAAAARLIDKSLLVRVDAPRPLYTMLETIRAYAGLELDAAGEREAALDGLARYCRAEATLAGEQLASPAQGEWLDRVHDDLDNYRAAMSWLVAGGRGADACDIAWGLIFFWLIRGHQAEGLEWYERILSTPHLPPAAEARALIGASMIWHTHGNRTRARAGLTRALSLDIANAELIAIAENVFGHLEHADGNLDAARSRFTRSLATFRDSGIAWGTGNALIGMAAVALATGNVAEAERMLDEATSVLAQAGPWFLNLPLYIRAILAVRQGDAGKAIGFAGASLRCSRQLHDRFAFVYALTPLAVAAGLKGDAVWAARILGARDAVMERTGVSLSEMALQQLRERVEREGRTRLGPVRWARARAAGRSLSIDALLKDLTETPQ